MIRIVVSYSSGPLAGSETVSVPGDTRMDDLKAVAAEALQRQWLRRTPLERIAITRVTLA